MARSSRTGRGKRAGYKAPAPAAAKSKRKRSQRPEFKPAGQPKSQTGAPRERAGARNFVVESIGELRKVEWPGQRQLISATVVVLIAVAIVGAFLFVADEVFRRLVRDVLLNF